MKERPILFNGSMVRAILEGRKTQTRRIVKPEWWRCLDPDDAEDRTEALRQCPYGQSGDRLWVRETWRTAAVLDDLSPHGMASKAIEAGYVKPWAPIRYEADGHEVNTGTMDGPWGKTRVSIHMPRWASRLTLEVTGVRVERLQDISDDDARAEGAEPLRPAGAAVCLSGPVHLSHVVGFRELWCSINGPESWDANPWVWVLAFRRLEGAPCR